MLGGLPNTRPHRRSSKRPPRPVPPTEAEPARIRGVGAGAGQATRKARISQPPQPRGAPRQPPPRKGLLAAPPLREAEGSGVEVISFAVQAAAELAEIGMNVTARTIRRAVSRLPRP